MRNHNHNQIRNVFVDFGQCPKKTGNINNARAVYKMPGQEIIQNFTSCPWVISALFLLTAEKTEII